MPLRTFHWCVAVCLSLSSIAFGAERSESPKPRKRLTSAALDALIVDELSGTKFKTASDEQFLRRVTLTLVGRQPRVSEFEEFLTTAQKGDSQERAAQGRNRAKRRAALVEQLLASDEFGTNWANYWSDTISYRVPPPELSFLNYGPFKAWVAEKLNTNAPWNDVTRDILTASGMVKENPPTTFIAYHQGEAKKLAAETARIWLGVQIQCAECHDHPFEDWKRSQFHELAAFYARAKGKLGKTSQTNDGTDATVTDGGKGEYVMPNADDPKKDGTVMAPVFMTGEALPLETCDADRRKLLAEAITGADNPWFARAYVNRIWGQLMGRGFFEPVDDMGSHKSGHLPRTHAALAESFIQSGYDVKALMRLIVNTQAYQRQLTNDSPLDDHVVATSHGSKLRGDEVFDSLVIAIALPNVTPPAVKPTKEIRFPPPPKSTRELIGDTFGFDPSLAPGEVFRSMGQAMLLMNNDQLQAQINAASDSGTMLSKL
ncbi:MAG TPA: DUF1549 domain-containing protein, partial [Pirellulales bacterium]|nr:DUF1549 domain-containing protein [Pirellulales bacterium]